MASKTVDEILTSAVDSRVDFRMTQLLKELRAIEGRIAAINDEVDLCKMPVMTRLPQAEKAVAALEEKVAKQNAAIRALAKTINEVMDAVTRPSLEREADQEKPKAKPVVLEEPTEGTYFNRNTRVAEGTRYAVRLEAHGITGWPGHDGGSPAWASKSFTTMEEAAAIELALNRTMRFIYDTLEGLPEDGPERTGYLAFAGKIMAAMSKKTKAS